MDEIIYLIALLLFLIGIVGSFLPILPGPFISFLGVLLVFMTTEIPIDNQTIWILGFLMLVVTAGDYILQIVGVKKLGGGKNAIRGTIIGSLLGLFVPPFGILLGALIGAFVGAKSELNSNPKAFKIALGAFIGFLLGTGVKLVYSIYILYYFTTQVHSAYF